MSISRHFLRILAMQTLYEWDFRRTEDPNEILARNIKETASNIEATDKKFASELIAGTISHTKEIDELIKVAAPEWPISQIAAIDRTVLRLGVFELLYIKEIPPKVAINEAIELAKAFGGENSGKFVNGVLGTIYRSSDLYVEEDPKEKLKKTAKVEKESKPKK
ncbi:transcription antitermination factor NusB [bacterium]|nr:transcription antitermination factor NusB [bacterium]